MTHTIKMTRGTDTTLIRSLCGQVLITSTTGEEMIISFKALQLHLQELKELGWKEE